MQSFRPCLSNAIWMMANAYDRYVYNVFFNTADFLRYEEMFCLLYINVLFIIYNYIILYNNIRHFIYNTHYFSWKKRVSEKASLSLISNWFSIKLDTWCLTNSNLCNSFHAYQSLLILMISQQDSFSSSLLTQKNSNNHTYWDMRVLVTSINILFFLLLLSPFLLLRTYKEKSKLQKRHSPYVLMHSK